MKRLAVMVGLLVGWLVLAACDGNGSTAPPDVPTVDAVAGVDAPKALNGCMRATAVDLSAPGANRVIQISDDIFTPKCLRIAPGQSVTWQGDFSNHPLQPGALEGGEIVEQPGNPILATSSGNSVTFTFPAGDWAFYCPNHVPGMVGALFAVAPP